MSEKKYTDEELILMSHDLMVYTIVETDLGKSRWREIGSAYQNPDESITVRLDALPANGCLHIRRKINHE